MRATQRNRLADADAQNVFEYDVQQQQYSYASRPPSETVVLLITLRVLIGGGLGRQGGAAGALFRSGHGHGAGRHGGARVGIALGGQGHNAATAAPSHRVLQVRERWGQGGVGARRQRRRRRRLDGTKRADRGATEDGCSGCLVSIFLFMVLARLFNRALLYYDTIILLLACLHVVHVFRFCLRCAAFFRETMLRAPCLRGGERLGVSGVAAALKLLGGLAKGVR